MEIEYIREFIVLAKLENYIAASEELYISQPSLSKHIKNLESELGVPLFDRTTRRVRLNRFGQAFLPYAKRIAEASSEFRASLSKLVRDVDNVVHLGVLPSFIAYGIQDHVTNFRQQYPDYLITLIDGANDELLRALTDGRCNLVFVRHSGDISASHPLAVLPYVRDHLSLIIPQGHPLADGRTTVRAEELQDLKLMTSTSSTMAQLLSDFSAKSGIQLDITARFGRSSSIIAMVKKDFGAALLMQTPSSRGPDGIVVLPIEPAVTNTVSLVYAKDKPLSRAARSFIQTVFPNGVEGDERRG